MEEEGEEEEEEEVGRKGEEEVEEEEEEVIVHTHTCAYTTQSHIMHTWMMLCVCVRII